MWKACLIEWYHFWDDRWPGKVFAEIAKMAYYRSVLVAHTLAGRLSWGGAAPTVTGAGLVTDTTVKVPLNPSKLPAGPW